jgi:hypothetical protein
MTDSKSRKMTQDANRKGFKESGEQQRKRADEKNQWEEGR